LWDFFWARRANRRKKRRYEEERVKYEIDVSTPPALTSAQKASLKALQAKPESEIDYSLYIDDRIMRAFERV
jgi:hypothetical protein